MELLNKEREEKILLLNSTKENTPNINPQKETKEDGSTGKQVQNEDNSPNTISKDDGISAKTNKKDDLSSRFIEEVQNKKFDYDKEKYSKYLKEISKKRKWKSMGEEKLVELFPCFSVLINSYKEKIFSKRSKLERDLIVNGQVESKSMIETKGRIVTSAVQFFLLLQKITIDGNVKLEDLFNIEKIKVYIKFMEELGREPCSICNLLLILKFIIKNFKSTTTFQEYQNEMTKVSSFLDIQYSNQKSQNFNKQRPNSSDLIDSGHFIENDEFTLLIIFILEEIKKLIEIKEKSKDQIYQLEYYCYSFMSLLDGGLRREVIARLRIDSLIFKDNSYYLRNKQRKQIEEIVMKYQY